MKKRILIGIPAYNEERSIESVVMSALSQKGNFDRRIAVFSDGSRDKSVEIIKNIKNKYVEVIESKKQVGKTAAIKALISKAKTEKYSFLVILDADLQIKSNLIVSKLFKKITANNQLIAVSGFAKPIKAENLAQKIGQLGFYVWEDMVQKAKVDQMFFRSSDPVIILRIADFPEARIKKYNYMHDEFYYLYAKSLGKRIGFEKGAVVYFSLPANLKDYVKQMSRYLSRHISDQELDFLPNKRPHFTVVQKIRTLMIYFNKDLIVSLAYLLVQVYVHLVSFISPRKIGGSWSQISSTK
ncbi:MAG TPA: glycosyltransferase [Patescibacteria group bacterium]|nr:glycosyltransferase [Patescibacteria group bacterium]